MFLELVTGRQAQAQALPAHSRPLHPPLSSESGLAQVSVLSRLCHLPAVLCPIQSPHPLLNGHPCLCLPMQWKASG